MVHTGGHSTAPAYGGEPHALLARRRREVVTARLGRRAAALDDLAQATTFATRAAGRACSCAATTGASAPSSRGLLASRRTGLRLAP